MLRIFALHDLGVVCVLNLFRIRSSQSLADVVEADEYYRKQFFTFLINFLYDIIQLIQRFRVRFNYSFELMESITSKMHKKLMDPALRNTIKCIKNGKYHQHPNTKFCHLRQLMMEIDYVKIAFDNRKI